MTRSDLLRRGTTVLALLACLLAIAGVAQAKFGSTASRGLAVGTATMVAPTALVGSFQCRTGFLTEGVTFSITSFTDAGPGATSYRFTAKKANGAGAATVTSTTRSGSVSSQMISSDLGATTWVLTVETVLGGWTSPVYTKSVTCAFLGANTGPV